MAADEIKFGTPEEREQLVGEALKDPELVEALVELLSGHNRSKRQKAAAVVALIAAEDAAVVAPYASEIADAVEMPEAQTRWECLNSLCAMLKAGIEVKAGTVACAEDALFDEGSGIVREAAFRFHCLYGMTGEGSSDLVWPNLDEAIQCHHGNPEFNDMLGSLVAFSEAPISKATAAALAERMRFDAENAKGTLRMRSEQIMAACAKH